MGAASETAVGFVARLYCRRRGRDDAVRGPLTRNSWSGRGARVGVVDRTPALCGSSRSERWPSGIGRAERYHPETLIGLLGQLGVATVDGLRQALGAARDETVCRKLAGLDFNYGVCYPHRGGSPASTRSLASTGWSCGRFGRCGSPGPTRCWRPWKRWSRGPGPATLLPHLAPRCSGSAGGSGRAGAWRAAGPRGSGQSAACTRLATPWPVGASSSPGPSTPPRHEGRGGAGGGG